MEEASKMQAGCEQPMIASPLNHLRDRVQQARDITRDLQVIADRLHGRENIAQLNANAAEVSSGEALPQRGFQPGLVGEFEKIEDKLETEILKQRQFIEQIRQVV